MHQHPNDAESRALRLLRRGKRKAAVAVVTVGICRDTSAGDLWLLRAIIHHGERKWATALNDIEHALTLMPLPASGQMVLADCYSQTGKYDLAVMAYQHLLTCDELTRPMYASIYAGLVRCNRRDMALECCRIAVRANPDDHAAYYAMAHCMVSMNYPPEPVCSVLETALGLEPHSDAYRLSLAIQHTRCGEPSKAHASLQKVAVGAISDMTCTCSIKCLHRVCLWADDQHRAEILTRRLADLQDESTDSTQGEIQ